MTASLDDCEVTSELWLKVEQNPEKLQDVDELALSSVDSANESSTRVAPVPKYLPANKP
jgi:hypothetical protein